MIAVKNLTKGYDGQEVLGSLSFDIPRGRTVALFGPNGCGKSTLIRILAGLERADSGGIITSDAIRPAYVFQDYRATLLPWRTVAHNIFFVSRIHGISDDESLCRAREILEILNYPLNFDAYPETLSGGQAQVTALLRALVVQPDFLVLDEPFSALDYLTGMRLRQMLSRVTHELDLTTLIVSHSPEEAIFLADKLILVSQSPATVVEEIAIDAASPRDASFLDSTLYRSVHSRALSTVLSTCSHTVTSARLQMSS